MPTSAKAPVGPP